MGSFEAGKAKPFCLCSFSVRNQRHWHKEEYSKCLGYAEGLLMLSSLAIASVDARI